MSTGTQVCKIFFWLLQGGSMYLPPVPWAILWKPHWSASRIIEAYCPLLTLWKKSTHSSLYHRGFFGGELIISTEFTAIPPSAIKPPPNPNPSQFLQKWHKVVVWAHWGFNSPSQQQCDTSSYAALILLCPVPKVGVPFLNFPTVFPSTPPLRASTFLLTSSLQGPR